MNESYLQRLGTCLMCLFLCPTLLAQQPLIGNAAFRPGSTGLVQQASGIFPNTGRPPRTQSLNRQPGTPGTRGPAQDSSPKTVDELQKEEEKKHPLQLMDPLHQYMY